MIIERLLLINPFLNDPTDRINHTETRPCMYMHHTKQREPQLAENLVKKTGDGTTLVNLRIVICVLILLNERELYSILLSVVRRLTFKHRQNPLLFLPAFFNLVLIERSPVRSTANRDFKCIHASTRSLKTDFRHSSKLLNM